MVLPRQFVFQNQVANLFDLVGLCLAAQRLDVDDFGNPRLGVNEVVTLGTHFETQGFQQVPQIGKP
jgi:hypothetical protein